VTRSPQCLVQGCSFTTGASTAIGSLVDSSNLFVSSDLSQEPTTNRDKSDFGLDAILFPPSMGNGSNMQIVIQIQVTVLFACFRGTMRRLSFTHISAVINIHVHQVEESEWVLDDPLLILVAVDKGPDDDPYHNGRHGEGNEFLCGTRPLALCKSIVYRFNRITHARSSSDRTCSLRGCNFRFIHGLF